MLSRAQDASELIGQAIAAVGGHDALYRLRDVQYTYHRGDHVSLERYIFDGEISYGRDRTEDGPVREQYYNGRSITVLIDGQIIRDTTEIKTAFFNRKTNFYWLTMVQKLDDPGVIATHAGERTVEGIPYQLVEVTFEDGVGVAKDRYLLYINPVTHLIDQFLFTVAAIKKMTPTLMKYTYGVFEEGVRFPVISQSHPALDWEGTLDPEGSWSMRYRDGFRFDNDFTAETIRQ
ncbi:MAG: DUF6503 family protein [Lewinella sp.]